MKVKAEFIGCEILVPQLGIIVKIEANKAEEYWKLGLFHIMERENVIAIKEPAKSRRGNGKRTGNRADK